MLRLENITKSYPQRGMVLSELNLMMGEGDSIAITGPSGSGKTTLMNIIGALDRPDSGDVLFRDSSILQMSPDESARYRNRNIGFVFQDHLLLPHLTVSENILLPASAFNITTEEYHEKMSYAGMLMEKTGISDLRDKYPYNISGGEAQRVTLVRALINKPSMLLADEPTGSLDSRNAGILGSLLAEINNELGISLIVVTHSGSLASKMRVRYTLEEGRLIR
ncbi:MAG: ABC transporter ATP-binding protein [Bacteroidales bacterium]|jgi:ABC-type lipoprotein export system ATPase subunit|nr:ABC transporter ATP-binding protein [Bacteroidales bacterium]